MAIVFNQSTITAQPMSIGVKRQRLLTDERVKDTRILLDRLTLAPGATARLDRPEKSVAWLQVLDGDVTQKAVYTDRMTNVHSVFLPPQFSTTLSTSAGASLLYAEIPDVGRIKPDFLADRPHFMVVDWSREPVLACEHDARKRVPLVTEDMCEARAIKVEMVIYPAGTMSRNSRHEGADTVLYILSGRGTAWATDQQFSVQQGEVLYFPDREQHYLKAADDGEMRFLAIHIPGEFKTVWADPNKISVWRSTDRDIHGWETGLDEKERKAFRFVFPFAS